MQAGAAGFGAGGCAVVVVVVVVVEVVLVVLVGVVVDVVVDGVVVVVDGVVVLVVDGVVVLVVPVVVDVVHFFGLPLHGDVLRICQPAPPRAEGASSPAAKSGTTERTIARRRRTPGESASPQNP